MNALAILSLISTILQTTAQVAPIAIEGIGNAKGFATDLWKAVTGKAPSAEDEARIDAALAELVAKLETPLPPAQPGDPDYPDYPQA